jgi:hypothetical protein
MHYKIHYQLTLIDIIHIFRVRLADKKLFLISYLSALGII